ncbi:MAG TPA: DUF2935 domain-containing protein [Haloplasmataceae bacterium]
MMDISKEMGFGVLNMRDHALLLYTNLSLKEQDIIKTTQYFLEEWDKIYQEVSNENRQITKEFLENSKKILNQFTQFKKILLTKLMRNDIELTLTPTYLNHMINEAIEFKVILTLPFFNTLDNLRLHKIWLPIMSGHAKYLLSQLDEIEIAYLEKAQFYKDYFIKMFIKAYEMCSIIQKTGLKDKGIYQFNKDVEEKLHDFIDFLKTIEKHIKEDELYKIGTFTFLILNHMIREVKHYLNRLLGVA